MENPLNLVKDLINSSNEFAYLSVYINCICISGTENIHRFRFNMSVIYVDVNHFHSTRTSRLKQKQQSFYVAFLLCDGAFVLCYS